MATLAPALPGIGPGQLVRIAIPGQERVTASVEHVTSAWLVLRLVGPGSPAPKDLDGERAGVEYIVQDGVHRMIGDLVEADGSSSCTVRFVVHSGPQLLGRREHLRAALAAPVVLTAERTGEKFRGRTVNVSEGGMLVDGLGSGLPRNGTSVKFALAPRDSRDSIVGSAVVIRVNDQAGDLAVSFDRLPRWAADELVRIVFEQMQGASRRR